MFSFLQSKMRLFVCLMMAGALTMTVACKQKTPEDRLQEARELAEERQMALSIIKLKDLIQEHPESDEALQARMLLAQLYAAQRTPENIRKAIEQLEAIWQGEGLETQMAQEAYRVQIGMLSELKEIDAAVEHARQGVERFKVADKEAQDQMRLIYGSLLLTSAEEAEKEEGVTIFREAISGLENQQLAAIAKESLADFYRRSGEFMKSNEVYDLYIEAHPDDPVLPELKMAKAMNLRSAGETDAAEELFEEGAQGMQVRLEEELDNMRRAEMMQSLSTYYEAFGKRDKAIEMLQRIMSEMPMSRQAIMAQFGIGHAHARGGDFDKATEIYSQIAQENPNTNIAQEAQSYIQQLADAKAQGLGNPPAAADGAVEEATEAVQDMTEMPAAEEGAPAEDTADTEAPESDGDEP